MRTTFVGSTIRMSLNNFPRGLPGGETEGAFPDASWWSPDTLAGYDKWQMQDGSIFVGAHG